MSLFKVRRWIRLINEAFLSLIFIAFLMIMYELWLHLYDIRKVLNRANPELHQNLMRR